MRRWGDRNGVIEQWSGGTWDNGEMGTEERTADDGGEVMGWSKSDTDSDGDRDDRGDGNNES